MRLPEIQKTQGDEQLAQVVQADVHHPEALPGFFTEGVQDQDDIAEQEQEEN